METLNKIAVVAILYGTPLLVILLIAFVWIELKLRRLRQLQNRVKQTAILRLKVLYMFGNEAYDKLPDYETMLYDKKKLEIRNYIKADDIINLN